MRNNQRKRMRKIIIYILAGVIALSLCACGQTGPSGNASQATSQEQPKQEQSVQPGNIVYPPDSYDSKDTAVIVKKDGEADTVTLFSTAAAKTYTLNVTGTSTLYDKYGAAVSLEQMKPGDVVEVTFLKDIKRLNSMSLHSQAWSNSSVSRYEIDWERGNITIGKDVYQFSEDTLFLSQGKQIEQMDLNVVDVLTFQGIGSNVLSVTVEKGHGYLRLENDTKFIGGFIEVGQSMITKIKEDMLLTVPEGDYQVHFSVEGGSGTKTVSIRRNQEVSLDIGDLEVEEVKYGTVIFTLNPSEATLYIDGEKADASVPVSLEYGIHQLIARAEGYKTLTTYLKVGQATTGIDIELDKMTSTEKEDDKEESKYKIYIDAPTGAEVYLDGTYVGIAPVSFAKEAGTHNITLRKSGYETRSYTIVVDAQEKDISYSFADLVISSLNSLDSIVLQ